MYVLKNCHQATVTKNGVVTSTSKKRMNYAEDRLDRRARHVDSSSKDGLWADYQQGLAALIIAGDDNNNGHELLARTLRDVGWCRHATFHYGMAWKHSWKQVGDYAQMLEFAGFPELGFIALLYFRCGRQVFVDEEQPPPETVTTQTDEKDPSWLRQNPPPLSDCGCGYPECGRRLSFLPASEVHPVIEALQSYQEQCQSRMAEMPSSYSVLVSLSKSQSPYALEGIPELLQFWNTDASSEFVPLEPVLQLLLVKLLYVTIPALAAEAVVHLEFENPRALANDYKSHWAYFVMIRAVVLGERIKPHRRLSLAQTYAVPGTSMRRNHVSSYTRTVCILIHISCLLQFGTCYGTRTVDLIERRMKRSRHFPSIGYGGLKF